MRRILLEAFSQLTQVANTEIANDNPDLEVPEIQIENIESSISNKIVLVSKLKQFAETQELAKTSDLP